MKQLLYILLLTLSVAVSAESTKRVAMLISSNGSAESPQLSYDLEELAQAYLILHDNGIELDIVSPKGGQVLVKNHKDDLAFVKRFKGLALTKLNNTIPSTQLTVSQYDGVFVVGGDGAMIDLPIHTATQEMLTQFIKQNSVIAAVCHGPAAIANIKLDNGQFFVAGKRVNAFTNLEEQAFSAENMAQFPFLNEDRLKENGATFVNNSPMLPYVAVSDNLITAQNPISVPSAAEAMVIKLGLPLKERQPFKDEATMALISKARQNGAFHIDIALANSAEQYDLNYLALYGFYAYRLAPEQDQLTELNLMATIASHVQHPMYESALIQAFIKHGQKKNALKAFELFKQRYPKNEQLAQLQKIM